MCELNFLLSNLIDQKRYSHCRICLKNVQNDNFAKFFDCVTFDNKLLTLSHVLVKLFGVNATEEVPGVEVVCPRCVDDAIKCYQLMVKFEESSARLHGLVERVSGVVAECESAGGGDPAYIVLLEEDVTLVRGSDGGEHRDTNDTLMCLECNDTFKSVDELTVHNLLEHNQYTCKQCLHTSANHTEIAQHAMRRRCRTNQQHRPLQQPLNIKKSQENKTKCKEIKICPKCGKSYSTSVLYMKHVRLCLEGKVVLHPMRSDLQKSYVCSECGKGYSTAGGLRVHTRFTHGDAVPHVCDHCGKAFTAPSYLRAHQVTHTGQKDHTCHICTRKFVTKEALLHHTRRHTGEKPYQCNKCDERFVNSSARAEHIKHKHIGPTLSCDYCTRKFVTKNFLRLHVKKHHDPTNKLYIGRRTDVNEE